MRRRILLLIIVVLFALRTPIDVLQAIGISLQPSQFTVFNSETKPEFFLKAGNRLYFQASRSGNYWVTDGTNQNTFEIYGSHICLNTNWYQHSDGFPAAVGGVVFFPGADCQLWRTDGTVFGTYRLSQGIPTSLDSGIVAETPVNNRLIFFTGDNLFVDWSQYSLWGSDDTTAGTKKLLSLDEAGSGTKYIRPVVFQNIAYFFTIHASNADQNIRWVKFWRTDGTATGTEMVFDSRNFTELNGVPEWMVVSGDHIFFTVRQADFQQILWQSDGTYAGTLPVSLIDVGQVTDMVDTNGTLFFINRKVVKDGNGYPWLPTLYKTRGKEQDGLVSVYTFSLRLWDDEEKSLTAVGGRVFFRDTVGDGHPSRLWVSDGSFTGTRPVMVNEGKTFPDSHLVSVGTHVAFVGVQETNDDEEIWFSDGTEAGSYPVTDLDDGDYEKFFGPIAYVDGKVFFAFKNALLGYDMWMMDFLTERVYLPMINK